MRVNGKSSHLIDLLHLGALLILQLWQIIIVILIQSVILINRQTKLDHTVDARGEGGWLIQGEARGQHRGVEQQPDQVLHSLVVLVLLSTSAEGLDDSVAWVDLHGLL